MGLIRLVLVKPHANITAAIQRQKAWKCDWKIRLIEENNPE